MTVFSTRSPRSSPYGLSQEPHHLREIAVVHQRDPRRDRVGDHDPARFEPAIAGDDDRDEHPLVDPEPSKPLRDDHIDRLRQLDVRHVILDDLDDVRDPVRAGQLLRQDGNRRLLHRIDARSARPRGEQAQDAASRPDIENDVAGTHNRVDRTLEGSGADAVANHRPVDLELRVHRVRRGLDRRPHVSCPRAAADNSRHRARPASRYGLL